MLSKQVLCLQPLLNTWTQALRCRIHKSSCCMAAEVTQWHLRQPVASNPVVFFGVLTIYICLVSGALVRVRAHMK